MEVYERVAKVSLSEQGYKESYCHTVFAKRTILKELCHVFEQIFEPPKYLFMSKVT